jgi:hypothetical protein
VSHLWAQWVPRVEDYWASFSAPYRQKMTDLIDKLTPVGGSVMDFGAGVGVQAFLLRQRRPDVTIYAIDCNESARNLTRVLMGVDDDRLIVEDTPAYPDAVREVDTCWAIFACAYLPPDAVGRVLQALHARCRTMILCEPCNPEPGSTEVRYFHGLPCIGYCYPYATWLERLGSRVEVIMLDPDAALNAITIATKET